MGFFIFIIIAVILSFIGYGKFVPFLFVAYLLLAMLFSSFVEGELGGFFKIFILPILILSIFGFILSQCSNSNNKSNKYENNSLPWWKTNTCGEGSWFDKFSDGRGQWRNPDGKFCSR